VNRAADSPTDANWEADISPADANSSAADSTSFALVFHSGDKQKSINSQPDEGLRDLRTQLRPDFLPTTQFLFTIGDEVLEESALLSRNVSDNMKIEIINQWMRYSFIAEGQIPMDIGITGIADPQSFQDEISGHWELNREREIIQKDDFRTALEHPNENEDGIKIVEVMILFRLGKLSSSPASEIAEFGEIMQSTKRVFYSRHV
jgi:hypothetical protein